jgi:carbon storage regulator CsrA
MLVLSRRTNEKIVFPGFGTSVQVLAIKAGVVRLGIQAPPAVTVLREEVQRRRAEWQAPEAEVDHHGVPATFQELNQLINNRLHVSAVGLAQLRQLLQAGLIQDAELTLAKIDEDWQLLRQRLEGEVEKARQRPPALPRRLHRALLVEDNANERELLASFLRMAGLDVDTAGDGSDALDYLHARGRPDVVLLDMGLPRCDGPTTVREIRRQPAFAGLKIFAVSGHLPTEFDLASGPTGIDRWFHKPIDPAELVRDINQEFERAAARV